MIWGMLRGSADWQLAMLCHTSQPQTIGEVEGSNPMWLLSPHCGFGCVLCGWRHGTNANVIESHSCEQAAKVAGP